jgi:hypothetical protein|tara:strand:- start:794 stop:982 length:189 start_codon:yes stop_codon:yes gene_type:complete
MGFIVYKHPTPEQQKEFKYSNKKWLFNEWYHDGMPGGKQREKEYAKWWKENSDCKIVWDKVK